jgi:8-oxo-dGTP diphosphatase
MDTIKVVCGIVYMDGKILICRRKFNKSFAGFWEFPGGKVEVGEKIDEALKRELFEELGMSVEIMGYFTTSTFKYDNFRVELVAYRCVYLSATFALTDHDSYNWISAKDLLKYNLTNADVPIAKKLIAISDSNI